MARCICSLEWKQAIEYGKAKIKANLTELQNSQIKKLEKVLEKVREDQKNLKSRFFFSSSEKLNFSNFFLKN